MAITMKKKVTLGVLAIVLVLALAISGTLMLFTDTSDTATNVVTTGNVKIELQEKGNNIVDWTKIDASFTGIDWIDVAPGTEIDKYTRVVNKGSLDAYLRVKATVTLPASASPAIISAIQGLLADNSVLVAEANGYTFVPTAAGDDTVGYWYYTGTANRTSLAIFAPNAVAELVNPLTIPKTWGNEFQDLDFSIDFVAEAVQADNIAATDLTGLGWTIVGTVAVAESITAINDYAATL
ncbi:MAG: M73 family metallopeptidase, partial [Clostridiales Family XIII bacterium]|nr:M73 family metallopeptidase [Clostridiales Family XIII bacterium]